MNKLLNNLTREELIYLKKNLFLYRDLIKELGNKGRIKFKNELYSKNVYIVEYYPMQDKDEVINQSIQIYKNYFAVNVHKNEIDLVPKTSLLGGIRLICNDKMLDCSFLKFQKTIKNLFNY
ncbi:hypothetical protein [Candidatus Vampirococcus lugosii]|uniref:F-type ATPase subunit delta n=1 Tax=Candidatus Vampirococcus lugosii TaxID=2789015 RepID=A0ABS5QKR1_9BACT|nr:hypothetical protein [Candidatus Vampirococcus lugosii]MBS8121777.1 hypothetical protein [Candidatus Vampirococcus lugosii]